MVFSKARCAIRLNIKEYKLLCCYSYRYALIWEDRIVDYFTQTSSTQEQPACASLGQHRALVTLVSCDIFLHTYLCQNAETGLGHLPHPIPPSASQHTWPSLADVKVNVTAVGQHGVGWSPVFCPKRHLTHIFLACDPLAYCWAGGDVTFSFHPNTWALPTSQSCPVQPAVTSHPPSFPCRFEAQWVPYSLVCDYRRDCADGSDETFCTFPTCKGFSQFRCQNKQVSLACSL